MSTSCLKSQKFCLRNLLLAIPHSTQSALSDIASKALFLIKFRYDAVYIFKIFYYVIGGVLSYINT